MSTDLYEILEVQADATSEQIRKAYKKRALQTHPDRAPASEKAQAEERFRQVNNAYEVLNDPEKRLSYDRHGIWPPPSEDPRRFAQGNTRNHPPHPNIFTFTDPFELFQSFFGHANPFHDPSPFGRSRTFQEPPFLPTGFLFPSGGPFRPFDSGIGMGGGVFHDLFPHDSFMPPMMGGGLFHSQGIGNRGQVPPSFSSTSLYSTRSGTGGGQWVSESRSTSTINGLTTSVHERIDSLGNVHTTTIHPDGHETYTINGVLHFPGQIGPPPPPYIPHSNPLERPRRRHHHQRHQDHPHGRRDRYNAHRDDDRDYFPDYRHPRRPSA